MRTDFYLHNLWRWKCGLQEIDPYKSSQIDFNMLKKTEWSDEFEKLMRNRLLLGSIRYGRLNSYGKPKYDRINSINSRLKKYIESGNKEHLVDVANLCLCEFVECDHPNAHFSSIDDGEHTKEL